MKKTYKVAIILAVFSILIFVGFILAQPKGKIEQAESQKGVWVELPKWALELGLELPSKDFRFIESESEITTLDEDGFDSFVYFYEADTAKAVAFLQKIAQKLDLLEKEYKQGSGIFLEYDNASSDSEYYILYNLSSDNVLRVSAINFKQFTK